MAERPLKAANRLHALSRQMAVLIRSWNNQLHNFTTRGALVHPSPPAIDQKILLLAMAIVDTVSVSDPLNQVRLHDNHPGANGCQSLVDKERHVTLPSAIKIKHDKVTTPKVTHRTELVHKSEVYGM